MKIVITIIVNYTNPFVMKFVIMIIVNYTNYFVMKFVMGWLRLVGSLIL